PVDDPVHGAGRARELEDLLGDAVHVDRERDAAEADQRYAQFLLAQSQVPEIDSRDDHDSAVCYGRRPEACAEGPMKGHGVLAVVALATWSVLGATPAAAQHQHAASPRVEAARGPGLGEIMALQQMRHSKLWFAGSAGNWPLAEYELDELKEGFGDVRRL